MRRRECRSGNWQRFDEAVRLLKALLQPGAAVDSGTCYATPAAGLSPSPRLRRGVPVWIGSRGSPAGLRRVARLGDGWLAFAYNTTPEAFAAAMTLLDGELGTTGRPAGDFPHALVTMWAWITDKHSDAEHVLSDAVGPLVKKDPAELPRPDLRRPSGGVRGVAVPLCPRRLPPSPLLACR